jgi:hypothetical protein
MSIANIVSKLNAQGAPRNQVDPFIASLPQNVLSGAVDRAERVLREQAAEDEAAAREAYQREVAAAEAEYANSTFAKTQAWRENDPPAAAQLGVSIDGLAPARAMLVRFHAWLGQTRDQLAKLEAAREKFLDQIGAPKVTESELVRVEAEDRSGLLAWLRKGAEKADRPTIDEFRRQAVQTKLAEQTYQAQVARDALAALESEIAVLRRGVEELDKRHSRFAAPVLVEEAASTVAEYAATAERLRSLVTDLAGLVRVAPHQGLNRGLPIKQIDIQVPTFGAVKPRILVEDAEIARAAEPWRERERALITDPRADVVPAAVR